MKNSFLSFLKISCLLLLISLTACASGPQTHPRDPLEPMNRKITEFNEAVDGAVLKPVATTYRKVTPRLVRTGVGNFFNNLGDAWSFFNNSLQLRPKAAADSALRFSFNTIFGLGGILDIATEMNIPQHKQDFGQTLARYGVPTGPYLVLPFWGPSTIRDSVSLAAELQGSLIGELSSVPLRNSLYVLKAVDFRSSLLKTGEVLDQAALDKYSFTRDVFLQIRDNQGKKMISDDDEGGSLPEESEMGAEENQK